MLTTFKRMRFLLTIFLLIVMDSLYPQDCVGGQIHTQESFLYGRFEVSMRSVGTHGVISSFFLYNLDVGCNWPQENNEIDIEMTGDDEALLFTTHHPGPWYYTDSLVLGFNPHDTLHEYAIEWEPTVVRWFADGQLVNVQDQPFVGNLIHPMRVIMNLWAVDNPSWAGVWDPASMPLESEYDWVRIFDYTPGAGNAGTDSNYTLRWEDDFSRYDTSLWEKEPWGGFSGNFCTFKEAAVEFRNDRMYLQLEQDDSTLAKVPVTFSVDLGSKRMGPTDVIFLNGGFNNWCGNCRPMTRSGSVWTTTVDLELGPHEYLFTLNFWEENGGAPKESVCDYNPCDEWLNYGLFVEPHSAPITLETPCWGDCVNCQQIGLNEAYVEFSSKLLEIRDVMGRKARPQTGQLQFYLYEDGRVEKRITSAD